MYMLGIFEYQIEKDMLVGFACFDHYLFDERFRRPCCISHIHRVHIMQVRPSVKQSGTPC